VKFEFESNSNSNSSLNLKPKTICKVLLLTLVETHLNFKTRGPANPAGQPQLKPTEPLFLFFSFPLADSSAPRVSLTHLSSPPFSSLVGSRARVDRHVHARWDGRGEPARTLSAAPEPTRPVVGWFARGNPLLALASDAEGDVAASGGQPRHRPERIPQW
jgi:hypothetical protein